MAKGRKLDTKRNKDITNQNKKEREKESCTIRLQELDRLAALISKAGRKKGGSIEDVWPALRERCW